MHYAQSSINILGQAFPKSGHAHTTLGFISVHVSVNSSGSGSKSCPQGEKLFSSGADFGFGFPCHSPFSSPTETLDAGAQLYISYSLVHACIPAEAQIHDYNEIDQSQHFNNHLRSPISKKAPLSAYTDALLLHLRDLIKKYPTFRLSKISIRFFS